MPEGRPSVDHRQDALALLAEAALVQGAQQATTPLRAR